MTADDWQPIASAVKRLKRLLCRHDWRWSPFVNIATGENLGRRCRKCGHLDAG
jgi:hypothetical protein